MRVQESMAEAIEKTGVAEAEVLAKKAAAEADGMTKKFAAMSTMSEQQREIERTFIEWSKNTSQTDDVCVLGFEIK